MLKRNKKEKPAYKEIEESRLKDLKLFESVDGNFNNLGFAINYTRVPGGLIRVIINTEAMDQLFIPLPNAYFVL